MIVQDLYDHITHALHGSIADLSPLTLVNQAGRHMTTMHPWKWKATRYAYLATRAKISITDGDWTAFECEQFVETACVVHGIFLVLNLCCSKCCEIKKGSFFRRTC